MNGAVLLPYQQRWVNDKSPVKLIEKSRRIGLSYAEAADAVLHAASADGANVYYMSFNKEMTQSFIQDCAVWAKAFQAGACEIEESLIEDEGKQILAYIIRFDSGNFIQTFSSNPRNLRSKGRPKERLILDEAAFVDNLDELLKSAMAMTMWGGEVHIISTHNGADNPFNALVNAVRAGEYDYSLHRVTLDDAITEGLYHRICEVSGQIWTIEGETKWREALIVRYNPNADEELFCIPAKSGGAWLSRALIELRMNEQTPVLRYAAPDGFELRPDAEREAVVNDWLEEFVAPVLAKIPREAITFAGEDFGRSGDLTCLFILAQMQNLVQKCMFEIELRNVPFRQQEQIVFYIFDGLSRFTGAAFDARGNGQYLAEYAMQRYGTSRISQVMLSEGWYRDNMPPLKAAFEDGTLIDLPKDQDILTDLRSVQVDKGVARISDKRTTGADKGKRHGDSAIALALAYYASRELNKGEVTVVSRGRRSAKLFEGYA